MGKIICRAFQDTKNFLGWSKKTLLSFIISYGVALIVYGIWQGVEAVKEELIIFFIFGLAGVGTLAFLLFLIKLIQAPIYIRWEKEKEPRLKIGDVTEELYGGLGAVLGLIIHNQGTDRTDNCQGRLVEMEFAILQKSQSLTRWPTNQPLKWGEESWGISSGNISIPGLESAVLRIVRWSLIRDIPRLAYAYIDDARIDSLPTGCEILLVISITSQNSVPIYAICLLDTKWSFGYGYDVKLLGTSLQRPTISDARQLAVNKDISQ